MKDIDYLLPDMAYMVKLLKVIEKHTVTIEKIKRKLTKGIETLPRAVEKIQAYNIGRFSAICLYQDVCMNLYDNEKDVTYSLYQERFDQKFVEACFFDEANCLSLIKNTKIPGYDVEPDSPDFSFNLNYFILETLGFGFHANFVRNCMDVFVPDNKVLEQYHKGVMNLFEEKKNVAVFSDAYNKADYDELVMSIGCVFSMKCGPNDYNPLFEPVPLKELRKEEEEIKKKKQNCIIYLSPEDFEGGATKVKPNPFGKER